MMLGGPMYPKAKTPAVKPPADGARAKQPGTQPTVGDTGPRKNMAPATGRGYTNRGKIARTTPASPASKKVSPPVNLGGAARPKAEY